ncbi:MetQ/NlpA family ABC transporter substrate-binding protein [Anaerococcus sp. AGMB09787]|uniref:MetQ/NlpA family ABC transporter substrate-binding protein n=1 Tax=Anaerococcus sp. AGMB09787 TaxID=2922869 RepID=UPI001FAF8D67|nr:MetQ/NlpA family ABC transporter substrate-binding protein [Anaerococcus sp. AGMB09787]
MKNISKVIFGIFTLATLTACGAKNKEATTEGQSDQASVEESASVDKFKDAEVIKVGVVGEKNEPWEDVAKRYEEGTGKKIEFVKFSDYIEPNEALLSGDIDINSFQHKKYLEGFNEESGSDVVDIGDTVMAPLGIYSTRLKSVEELDDGARVAIPNDASNGARALFLLQSAGLIKVNGSEGDLITLDDITDNPKNLEIIELSADQTARSLDDTDAAVINSGMAVDAGFIPTEDSIYLEDHTDPAKNIYINIIATAKENENSEVLKDLVENYYQVEETAKIIEESSKGSEIPAFEY